VASPPKWGGQHPASGTDARNI